MDVDGGAGDRRRARSSDHRSRVATSPRQHLKQVFDVVVSGIVLVLTLPILLVAALAIRVESPGPVALRHARLGKDGVPFDLLKLRSTTLVERPTSMSKVTRVGRLIRWTSIDDLPQLWNVLRGEMSLVGPPPAQPEHSRQDPGAGPEGLRVLPGITGTWRESQRSNAG